MAGSASEARQHLEKQIGDTMSLADTLNQSQNFCGASPLMSARTMRLNSVLSDIRADPEERRPETARVAPSSFPEMGAFMINMKDMVANVMTEVQSLVSTARKETTEASTVQEPLNMPDL